jgi:hypothetical protein
MDATSGIRPASVLTFSLKGINDYTNIDIITSAVARGAERAKTLSSSSDSKLQQVQEIWRDLALSSARCCFDLSGTINLNHVRQVQDFWMRLEGDHAIPGIELVKEQTLAVLEKLLMPESPLMVQLSKTIEMHPSAQGENILGIMEINPSSPQAIPQAILQSLFTPHRQACLPTCSINALINAEIFNHPERLADIYTQILTPNPGNKLPLPISKKQIPLESLQPIPFVPPAYIRTTFTQREKSMSKAFADLVQKPLTTPVQYIAGTPDAYKPFGIELHQDNPSKPSIVLKDGKVSFSLDLPVHDLNDAFFANFVHTIYNDTDQSEVFIKVRDLYFDVPGNEFAGGLTFNADQGNSTDGFYFSGAKIGELINEAKRLSRAGASCALATVFSSPKTTFSPPMPEELSPYDGHLENINLRQLAALDINDLQGAKGNAVWRIGDRNWVNSNTGAPTYLSIGKIGPDQYGIFGAEYSPDGTLNGAGGHDVNGLALYPSI